MRKFLMTALIAGAAVTAASPAMAQNHGGQNRGGQMAAQHHGNQGRPGQWGNQNVRYNANAIRQQINQLSNDISRAQQRRAISPREATGLRRQVNNLQRQHAQFARNGLDRREVSTLQSGVNQVRRNLRMEAMDFDRFRG